MFATSRWFSLLVYLAAPLAMMPFPARATPPIFPGATADYRAWVAARLPGSAEGLAADKDGVLFASLWQSGQIVRLDGHGGATVIATVPTPELGKDGITTGLEFGPDGDLYVAYMWHYTIDEELDPHHAACRDARDHFTGVYRVNVKTGSIKAVLSKGLGWTGCFPDDIAFDRKGNMYVTDMTLSGLWRVAPDGQYSLWSVDPLLQWAPEPFRSSPEGANDLAITPDGSALIVVTDGNPGIVRVPIQADGRAGPASWLAKNLDVLDGIAIDDEGDIYVSEITREEISVFSPDGQRRIVIATPQTAPIVDPTSLIYRQGMLCVANMGEGVNTAKDPRTIACLTGFRRPEQSAASAPR